MCGSLSGYRSWKEMRDWYALIPTEGVKTADTKPSALIRPTDLQPFIRLAGPDRILDLGVWGFPPLKDKSTPLINARSETMDVLPTFRGAFLRHRCVVPVTGYYEWKREEDGSKTPWRFTVRGGRNKAVRGTRPGAGAGEKPADLFVLAGLFTADRKTGQRRFAIVTTEPNDLAADVHDRMPVILDDMGMKVWLSPDSGPQPLKRICRPYEGPGFAAEPVSRALHKRPKPADKNQLKLAL